jgi:PhzF family phenazine biosynthesis protein
MKPLLHQVDAFSDVPFHGNPAAVCLLDAPRSEAWLQAVAAEMNLSETAFLGSQGDGFALRWFTPTVEVPLCGHATLASAHVLYETGRAKPDATLAFETRSGRLLAAREGDWLRLDFPALPARPASAPRELFAALGVAAALVHEVPRLGEPSWLLELPSPDAVAALRPDFRVLASLPGHAVIATARGDGAHDFVSRFFAPKAGVDEDPVTGSAHCTLAPYWGERLGRRELTGLQLSQRTGRVRVRWRGERVDLLGRARTVLRGELDA